MAGLASQLSPATHQTSSLRPSFSPILPREDGGNFLLARFVTESVATRRPGVVKRPDGRFLGRKNPQPSDLRKSGADADRILDPLDRSPIAALI